MTHKLPPLRFPYDALEPYIDAETMELHHDKHHQAYVDNLNKAIEPYPQLADLTTEDLLRRLDQVPEEIRTAVRNHGGGHVNHQLFWEILGPEGGQAAEGRDRRRHREAFRLIRPVSVPLHRRGHEALRLGMGVSRREPGDPGARDPVAAQPGQRAVARQARAPLLRCLGARVLPEIQKPTRGLPRGLVERRRLGRRRPAARGRSGREVSRIALQDWVRNGAGQVAEWLQWRGAGTRHQTRRDGRTCEPVRFSFSE